MLGRAVRDDVSMMSAVRGLSRANLLVAFFLCGATAACADGVGNADGGPAENGGRRTRAVALPRPVCDIEEPTLGATCTSQGLRCGFGSSVRPDCRRNYLCQGTWQRSEIFPLETLCVAPPAGQCPDSAPVDDTPCGTTSSHPCEFETGLCFCPGADECFSTRGLCPHGERRWSCPRPPADLDCPLRVPNEGDGCDAQGVECRYDADGCGPIARSMFCRNGQWEYSGNFTACF